MAEEYQPVQTQGSDEIRETDIVFDCPMCGKSLAIDYRGAGLLVSCPDCQERVQVPIPEGMDVSDLDATEDEERARVIHLREALAESQRLVAHLQSEIADLKDRRDRLESTCSENARRQKKVSEEIDAVRVSVRQIEAALARIEDVIRSAT